MAWLRLSSGLRPTNNSLWSQHRCMESDESDEEAESDEEEEGRGIDIEEEDNGCSGSGNNDGAGIIEDDGNMEKENDENNTREKEASNDKGGDVETLGEAEGLKRLTVTALKERLKKKGLKVGGRKVDLISRLMGRQEGNVCDDETEQHLNKLTVDALKERLRKKGLKVGGKKTELISRLMGREQHQRKVKEWKDSEAKAFLTKLIRDEKSWIHKMSPEEIYESQPSFQHYSFPKFKEYLKSLQKANADLKEMVRVSEQEIWTELNAFPREEMTDRGYPFWDTHPARALLEQDVGDGKADEMKPKKLRETREEYAEFPLRVFRDHVHQEKRRKRETPGCVHRRNRKAQKMHEDEVNAMKDDWDDQQQQHQEEDMIRMCEQWELLRLQA
ncbi:hypothetical protein ACHAXR_008627 [Thalassiosira sp. AJA248-18]